MKYIKIKKVLFSVIFLHFVLGYAQDQLVSEVQITGVKKTKVSFVKSLLRVSAGTPLDSTLLKLDIEHLKRLPFIANANFKVVNKKDAYCSVSYILEENFTLIPFANLFSSSNPLALNVKKHLYKLIYNYNTINYHYQYLSGFKSYLNFQYVGSSDAALPEFLIGFNDFNFYQRVGEKGNWASRVRLGLATNIDTPFAPFTVDNNINIRGVGNTIDRGTAAIIINTEYRHTLVDKDWFVLQSNVFVDGGTWRNPGGDFGNFGESQNLRIYPGFGLRFMHKKIFNAIFRIDYGYGVTKDSSRGLVFGIGQYF